MRHIIVDPDSKALDRHFALIKARRLGRARYPEGCVTLVDDEAAALGAADPEQSLHAAEVYGPSVSSEGQRVFYLVRWLA